MAGRTHHVKETKEEGPYGRRRARSRSCLQNGIYIYKDTKCFSGVEPEYQWGEIYRLITRREVPDMGLEEESIYANIEIPSLMKIATRPELFLCSEVISWILPWADVKTVDSGKC